MFKDDHPKKWLLLAALFLLALAALVLFFGLTAQARQKTVETAAAGKERFLDIQELTTPGGLSVWFTADKSLPIVAVKFVFLDAGSALDPVGKQGLARMLSNTMDEGAGQLTSQDFQKELADNSITLRFNASRDGFGGELMSLARNQDKAFDLLALALNEPRFDAEPVVRMAAENLARVKNAMGEPDWMAARLLNDRAFTGHPYAMNSGGTLKSLPAISPDDLRKFKSDYLTRDRLLIAAAGDFDPAQLGAALDRIFGHLPASGAAHPIKDAVLANQGKLFLFEQNIPQTIIEMTLPAFDHRDDDFYAMQVMNYIYGGAGFGSRLMETAREQRGLTYGIYSSVIDYRHTDTLNISTSTKNDSAGEMLSIIRDKMSELANEPVSDKELADAKSYITGSMPLSLGSTSEIASVMLGLRMDGVPSTYLDHFADNIRNVTAEDVKRVAKRLLDPQKTVTVLVGKPAGIENVEVVKELPNV